jgi:hypothetical protein
MINMFDSLSLDEDWSVESEHGFSVKFLRFGGESVRGGQLLWVVCGGRGSERRFEEGNTVKSRKIDV